ncbi:hybrid sensor histidine kinase/response regulator [Neorhizobium lilium]|uniref:histidine kinase n=1 Tax=Neorhizobium lilium TaxID=2503024 RepID=A0A444LL18_9HYPH|nr:hybrid sensor histidine kinase/response regulator [Neorhizobium lilium]RWX81021.1 hybrid sensor histidine kinase/response regulator [Neorhizobium lilium]
MTKSARAGQVEEDYDTEKAQALVRIIIVAAAIIYVVPMTILGAARIELREPVLFICGYFFPFSLAAYWWIIKRPGVNRLRRTITITHDLGALTYTIALGGPALLPLFAIILWVTVGNGLRFGPAYLKASTATSLAGIAAITYFNPYWRANPFMVLTFAATTLLVPAYIYVLLGRLRKAYEAAQEASLSKSRFLAQASHDLRQPIHAISLFTACLRDANLQPKELQMVENIDRSLQSVSRLFKSLLDISTLDSGRVTPKYEKIAIAEVIEDVLRQNYETAQLSGVELRVVTCSAIVEVDRALFTTMLQNIVNNAIKYAAGRIILVGCRRRFGRLAVQVYDQGPGIPVEHQTKVFEEFYQVRERGDKDVEGVGLGLPIVRRLGRLLDIEVDMRSVPGKGTCMTLGNLPIVRKQARSEMKTLAGQSTTVSGLRVLLVEDDEAVLAATASLLRKWGCEVQAELAIPEELEECDLLITDFDLGGGITGTDCIRSIRERSGKDVPVVVMSGHDEARVREDLGSADIPILSKPVRPAELRSIIVVKALEARKIMVN